MNDIDTRWDLIIKPKRNLLDINLKEIWEYKDLISLFVRRDFVARYKQTILGPLWFVIGPIISTFMYALVFNTIAKIPTDNAPPVLFYLTGIVGWNYFSACLFGTSSTFTGNAGIFGKVYFPRLTAPIANIISNLIQFGIQFALLLLFIIIYLLKGFTINYNLYALLFPFHLLILASIGLGFGIIISALTTKYRDLTNFLGFGVQLWMYVTPIIYPVSAVPEKYRIFVYWNPIAPVIEAFKYGFIGTGTFSIQGLIYSSVFAFVVLIIGIILFNNVEKNFMDTV
jgi:lipopolysaccharide transport system permease protein